MTVTTFSLSWEQESSTGATTTASGVKVVGNFFEPVWVKVVIGVIVFLFLIVLTFVLYKTCKKEGGKYEVQKWIQQQTNPFYYWLKNVGYIE